MMIRRLPHDQLINKMWSDGVDKKEGANVDISFPDPPADVAAILRKAKKADCRICVAAEPAAISLDYESLVSAIDEQIKTDPIIYEVVDDVVFVLAQFGGEFTAEKELIDEITDRKLLFFPG